MAVITIRIPEQLKEKMRKMKINWSEEIRKFIAQRIAEEERKEHLKKALEILKGSGSVEIGFSAKSVREDRDSDST